MGWLAERGLISSYEGYLNLPAGVLDDARLLMIAEAWKRARDERRRNA